GRRKGFEQVCGDFRRDAWAVVFDDYLQAARVLVNRDVYGASALFGGVDGVAQQVDERVSQTPRVVRDDDVREGLVVDRDAYFGHSRARANEAQRAVEGRGEASSSAATPVAADESDDLRDV